jgi:hypothetical protein
MNTTLQQDLDRLIKMRNAYIADRCKADDVNTRLAKMDSFQNQIEDIWNQLDQLEEEAK